MDEQISNSGYSSSQESNNSCMTDYSSSDSLTSSITDYVCTICQLRCIKQTDLQYQYLNDDVFLLDLDHEIWLKCDECSSSYHKSCWEDFIECEFDTKGHFLCCKYMSQCPV